ncbi:MAG: ABC transporter ATP-binding protein [Thermodesulfobacteriota bacterium]
MAQTVIRMERITKRFPAVLANDRIDLEIEPGKIHALLGENGAGKTTLMNILSGRYRPDEGEVLVGQKPIRFNSPRDALESGIGMVHQHFMLIPNQTVAENIILGLHSPRFFLHQAKVEKEVEKLSRSYGLLVDPKATIDELSLGQQQKVEILKLLYRNAGTLILDEPTAVLTPSEIEELFTTLRNIAKEGKSVVFITHKLEEVMEIADRITILQRGRVIAHLTPDEVESRRELARLMVGREVVLRVEKEPVSLGEVVLELRDCSGFDERGHQAFHRITFAVRRGEIFAIVGVAGNGQSELVAAIMGLRPMNSGELLVLGRPIRKGASPRRESVGYVPEDRIGMGSLPNLDLVDNLILTSYPQFCRRGLFRKGLARKRVEGLLPKFHIIAPHIHALARQLSGGNLQKLILARELSKSPKLFIAEQPTHGLDIGATEEVWFELLKRRETAGILLVSGDLKEVLSLSDRIGVIFRGRLMDIFSTEDEDGIEEIGPMMAGVRQERKR